jgi:hypothetical protein
MYDDVKPRCDSMCGVINYVIVDGVESIRVRPGTIGSLVELDTSYARRFLHLQRGYRSPRPRHNPYRSRLRISDEHDILFFEMDAFAVGKIICLKDASDPGNIGWFALPGRRNDRQIYSTRVDDEHFDTRFVAMRLSANIVLISIRQSQILCITVAGAWKLSRSIDHGEPLRGYARYRHRVLR